jgi:hypothetical protein
LLASIVVSLAGCLKPSSIGVLFDIDLEVRGSRADGSTWQANATNISKGKPSPKEFDPYGDTIFRNREIEANFAVIKSGFSVVLSNLTPSTICFRFDQAKLSSNFEPTPKVLRTVLSLRDGGYPRITEAERLKGIEVGPVPMNKICVEGGGSMHIACFDRQMAAFPSGKMFNIAYPNDAPVLNPDGIGNWAILHLPVEYADRRESLEFKMTATQSRARAKYW